jgi:hypothetical protein
MTPFDPKVGEALDRQVPLRLERRPDWDDVVGRSRRGRRRRPRPLPGVIALAAMLAIGASALAAAGHDPFGSLGSWLKGTPGKPATAEEQAGFSARNGASYASFPASTRVHRLAQTAVAGRTFVLLGFESGESLCLRLVRADEPSSSGVDQCVTKRELDTSQAPALVAAESLLEVGKKTSLADSIIGFADDTVRAIQYRSGHGPWKTAPVVNNVFVGLVHAKGALVHSRLPQPISSIEQVRAVTRSGRTVAIPFVSGYVSYPPGGLPSVPSYVTAQAPRPGDLPGPAATTAAFGGGTISWLGQHERRGTAWHPKAFSHAPGGPVAYSRAVQPDPGSPLRVGLFLRVAGGMFSPRQAKPAALALCETDLIPLGSGGGYSCFPPTASGALFRPGKPFDLGGLEGGQQVTELTGVAADAVARLELYLASGRVVPVSLTDNAFSAGAPTTQFPAKLVAYDSRGRVIGLQMIGGPAHPVPCPTLDSWPASKLPATHPYQRLDLASLTIDGKHILGMTPAQVTAALGKPDRAAGFRHATFGQPTYFYGGTLPGALLRVQFRRNQAGTRVDGLDFQGRGLLDPELGHLLNVSPLQLEQSLVSAYGYRIASSYGSVPAGLGLGLGGGVGCSAVATSAHGKTEIAFGLEPYAGGRPFLDVSARPWRLRS